MNSETLSKGKSKGEDLSLINNKIYKYTKICKACGREFKTNSPQKLYCDREHYFPCPNCGEYTKFKYRDFTREMHCCSSKCSHELAMKNMELKTCILCGKQFKAKTGAGSICSDKHYRNCEICGKQFEVKRDHRDITVCSKECSKEKTRRMYQEKYGVDHPMQNSEVRKHHQQSMLNKYGVTHALKHSKFVHKQQETVIKTNMERHGVPYACMLPQCAEAQGKIISDINYNAKQYLNSIGVECSFEKKLDNYSYDILVEDQKTLIEIDPTYTHSIIPNHFGIARSQDYQLKKTQVANEYGYRCIHIFDWEDTHKILNLLLPKHKLYARNCKIYKLKPEIAKQFIEENHIQGNCRGQLLFLGLVMNNELYQVMSFGKPRYSKSHDVELLRLCTKQGYTVLGGASKLFKFFVDMYGVSNIVSYCDISKFDGKVYENIGMNLLRQTPPQEIWSKGSKHITANLLRQRGFDQLFNTKFGKGTNNEKLMLEHGWLPIYDCGMKVFEYR